MTTLNARANQAYHAVVEEAGENWMGFSHQRDAFEEGWETGYKAAEAETTPAREAIDRIRDLLAEIEAEGGSRVPITMIYESLAAGARS